MTGRRLAIVLLAVGLVIGAAVAAPLADAVRDRGPVEIVDLRTPAESGDGTPGAATQAPGQSPPASPALLGE